MERTFTSNFEAFIAEALKRGDLSHCQAAGIMSACLVAERLWDQQAFAEHGTFGRNGLEQLFNPLFSGK